MLAPDKVVKYILLVEEGIYTKIATSVVVRTGIYIKVRILVVVGVTRVGEVYSLI